MSPAVSPATDGDSSPGEDGKGDNNEHNHSLLRLRKSSETGAEKAEEAAEAQEVPPENNEPEASDVKAKAYPWDSVDFANIFEELVLHAPVPA